MPTGKSSAVQSCGRTRVAECLNTRSGDASLGSLGLCIFDSVRVAFVALCQSTARPSMWSVVKHLRLPCVSSNTCIPGCLSVHQFSNRRQMCFPWTIMTASKAVATSGISRFYTTPCSPWTVFSFSSSAPLQLETLQQEFFLEQRQGRSVDKPICQTTNWWLKKDRSRAPVTSASVCISFSELMKVSRTTLNQLACSLHYSAYSLMEFDSTTGKGTSGMGIAAKPCDRASSLATYGHL